MSARRLLSTFHPHPLHLHLPRRPISTNSAINRGLRRSSGPRDPPKPTQGRPPTTTTGIPRITRIRPPTPESGIWTPPGAPPRPKSSLPSPPPPTSRGGTRPRTWAPPGSRPEAEEDGDPDYAPRPTNTTASRPGRASEELTRSWGSDAPLRPPRPWSTRQEQPYPYSTISPRLDVPPAGGRDWAPKPRRFVPKLDPDAEWIYGSSVVEAALKAGRRKCLRLYIYAGNNRTEGVRGRDKEMARMAKEAGAEVVWEEDAGLLDSMSDSRPHNGYILETHSLPKTPILALGPVSGAKSSLSLIPAQHDPDSTPVHAPTSPSKLYSRSPKGRYPFVLMLDEIVDPGNLGAILRSAYFLGVTAVTLSTRNCAPLSAVVLKASAGAAEYLPLLEHARAEGVIRASVEHGWSFFAAVPPVTKQQGRRGRYFLPNEVGKKLEEGPVCLVVGNEGEGLRYLVQKECEFCVGLERAMGTDKVVDSLNVSVASALLCNAFLRG